MNIIEPENINPGDVVDLVQRTRMAVLEVTPSRSNGVLIVDPTDDDCWDATRTTYELVSRAVLARKPGSHWLDSDGNEWVVLARPGSDMFVCIDAMLTAMPTSSRNTASWTLKS